MNCGLPEMVVPIAFCRSEDSMSEMTCCNMKTKDVDKSDGRRGRGEKIGDQL